MWLMENLHQNVERIGGIKVNIGRMSVEALVDLRGHCEERLARDQADIAKVDAELAYREAPDNVIQLFPDLPPYAA